MRYNITQKNVPNFPLSIGENRKSLAIVVVELSHLHSLLSHSNADINQHRNELIDLLASWYATNIRLFQCVEDPGFIIESQVLLDIVSCYRRSLTRKVKAEDLLPCANTIKRRIQSLAEITRAEVSTRLVAAGSRDKLAFSPDFWTDRCKKQSYLGQNIFV